MKFLIPLFTAIALCLTAAMPAFANQTDEDISPPVAARGEPSIKVVKGPDGTRPYYTQDFPYAGLVKVSEPTGWVSTLYYAFGDYTDDLPAIRIPVNCRIKSDGSVSVSSCVAKGDLNAATMKSLQIAKYHSDAIEMPTFRALPVDQLYVSRSVDLELDIPAMKAPEVDLTSGPLVENRLINLRLDHNAIANAYPSRALRSEIEGLMEIECQIQIDRSIICTPLSFDPQEHMQLFERSARAIFRSTRPEPLLNDGTDARGVRWRSRIRFQMPD